LNAVVPYVLLAALLVHFGAHVAIVAGLAAERAFGKAAVALFIPPLAPWWAWQEGMRRRFLLWIGALAIYALGVAVI
jgi:hypothetical protein